MGIKRNAAWPWTAASRVLSIVFKSFALALTAQLTGLSERASDGSEGVSEGVRKQFDLSANPSCPEVHSLSLFPCLGNRSSSTMQKSAIQSTLTRAIKINHSPKILTQSSRHSFVRSNRSFQS